MRSLKTVAPLFVLFTLLARAEAVPEVAQLLAEVIRVDNSNPPGNEARLAALLEPKFRALGFTVDIIPTPQAGKAHFIARLRGDGSRKPILLAAHADTVGVEREKWSVDPFAGVIRDGFVMGRGAIDFKGGLAVFAQAVMNLAKNKVALARDVIFLSEADEEGGAYNTSWLASNAWDKVDCEFALNEGGWIIRDAAAKVLYVSISTADKTSVSLVLTAHGTSTHSSMPRPDNAIYTLARALTKLSEYDMPVRLTSETRQFFSALAEVNPEPMKAHFRNLLGEDQQLVEEAGKTIGEDPLLHAIMRNTIAPVLLSAGFRGNVIPGSAEATINFRIVPGTKVEELIAEVRRVIGDPHVEIKVSGTTSSGAPAPPPAVSEASSHDTPLFAALASAANTVYPGALVTPYLFQAGTDAGAWRSRGIPVYGIYPYPIDAEDLKRMHGNDERVSIRSLESGVDLIYRTLVKVAGKE